MMHIVVNLFKHWIPLLAGERAPTKSKKFKHLVKPSSKPSKERFCKRTKRTVPNMRYSVQLKAYEQEMLEYRAKVKEYHDEEARLQRAKDAVALFELSENGTCTHARTARAWLHVHMGMVRTRQNG